MRRSILVLVPVVLLSGMISTSAAASPPLHVRQPWGFSVFDAELTEACGTDVYWEAGGLIDMKVWFDANGDAVREIDTFPTYSVTVLAPATGNSITSPQPAQYIFEYLPGAEIGSYVEITANGLYFKVGGLKSTGHYVMYGHVIDYMEDNIPISVIDGLIWGVPPEPDFTAAICSILNPA